MQVPVSRKERTMTGIYDEVKERAEVAEEKLAEIAKIYETVTPLPSGFKGGVSTHAAYNLEGALIDLKRIGKLDEAIINTMETVLKQLYDIGKVLGK